MCVLCAVLASADISTLASSLVSVIQSLATLSSGPAFNLVIKGKSPSPHLSVRPLSYTRYSEKYDGSSRTLEQGGSTQFTSEACGDLSYTCG